MTVNYRKLNHVVTSIAISVSAVISMLKHINITLGTWHTAINLANAPPPQFLLIKTTITLVLSLQGQQYPFTVLPQEYINSPEYVII